jgi:hypothetical protein
VGDGEKAETIGNALMVGFWEQCCRLTPSIKLKSVIMYFSVNVLVEGR